jgi:hypothetical protein
MTPQTLGLQIAVPELIVRKFLTDYAVCDVKRAGGKVSALILNIVELCTLSQCVFTTAVAKRHFTLACTLLRVCLQSRHP